MSTTPNSPSGSDAAAGSHFTVEDAGSTTDAADLFHNDTDATDAAATRSDPGAPSAPGAPEPPQAPTGARPVDDYAIGHVFDQTNGVIDGFDGDSDGTAASDVLDASERSDGNPAFESFADTEAASTGDTDDTRVTGN